jgi:hypothetical protein
MTPDEQRYLTALKRRRAALSAKDDLLHFARLMMPKQDDHENPDVSEYQTAKHHKVIAAALEEVEKGKIKRLIINCPPRHGKSQLASRLFPAWYAGRNPDKSVIVATYNENFAADFGRDIRGIMQDPIYNQIFPEVELKTGAAAVDRLETEAGGKVFLAGVGGSLTGRGASLICLDDPIKGREDADSPTKREKLWKWWNEVLKTRLMTSTGAILLIQTRWHEDDLCGALTDPLNSRYSAVEAKKWRIIDLPALAKDNDVLGRKEGEALWPERFPTPYLHELREADPRGFQALYQGSPTPEKGNFFSGDRIRVYTRPTDRPPNSELRFYCASDHAVSIKQDRDKTCLIPVGVDEHENIWILDDVQWGRWHTDVVVEKMIDMMSKYKPLFWWAERGHISKSIGPFLRKRMLERNTFVTLDEIVPVQDKKTRAQSMQGRIAMGKVYFPSYAPWYQEARDQILKFPFGAHDDFVDAMAYIGLGLAIQVRARPTKTAKSGPTEWTYGWLKKQTRDADKQRQSRHGGW